MRAEAAIPLFTLFGFLLVLARVASALVFVPLPGVKHGPELARIVFALGFTVVLFPQWPKLEAIPMMGQLAGWLVLEAAFGIMIGLAVSFLTEAFLVGAQVVGLPAGYAYASVVDPQTQADSGVLLVLAQLTSGMLFFALGLDREVLRIFARSLEVYPPGALALPQRSAEAVVRLGAGIFSTGLRLAMPALVLAWMAVLFPRVYSEYGQQALGLMRGLIERGAP
jgi:flagellar biosynthetic protein FliR